MGYGTQNVLREAAQWMCVAALIAIGAFYFDDLKSVLGPSIDPNRVSEHKVKSIPKIETRNDENEVEDTSDYTERLEADANGHYYAEAELNGSSVDVAVDTGATLIAMTYEDAEEAGFYLNDSDFKYQSKTANGIARSARVTLDTVRIGDIIVRDVEASVSEQGKLEVTLLGMAFLKRLTKFEIQQGKLLLTQ